MYFACSFECFLHLCIVQGTSSDQDNRFSDKSKRLMKTMKFPDAISKKVVHVYVSSLFYFEYV